MAPPGRRLIALGASNLARGLRDLVGGAHRVLGGPLEVMAAIGHGRSYGQTSRLLGRSLPGILQCGLWEALASAPPRPSFALVTDIGNDLAYGAAVGDIAGWVEGCLDRLQQAGAQVVMTELPLANLEALSPLRFHFFRAVLFPTRRVRLAELRAQARELQERLAASSRARGISLVPLRPEWYGIDPIHIRRRDQARAWMEVIGTAGLRPEGAETRARRLPWRGLRPQERSLLGIVQRREQPCARLDDGTSLALY